MNDTRPLHPYNDEALVALAASNTALKEIAVMCGEKKAHDPGTVVAVVKAKMEHLESELIKARNPIMIEKAEAAEANIENAETLEITDGK